MTNPYKKIMDDITSDYDVSWACIQGEHYKCKSICSCSCHRKTA